MSDEKVYPVNDDYAAGALVTSEQYDETVSYTHLTLPTICSV